MSARQGFTDRVMAFLRENPSRWINAVEFEAIGGRQAWRSRIAEARLRFQAAGEGTIENQQRRQTVNGRIWTLSSYMFVPTPTAAPREPHNLNQPWGLR